MRIAHIITGLSAGGAEHALYNILANGLRDQFENTVISLSDKGVFYFLIRDLGISVHSLGIRRSLPSISAINNLRQLVRRFRPDVIQGWMYHGNLAATIISSLALNRPKLVWNIRQSLYRLGDEKRLTRWVIRGGRLLSSCPDAIIYNSQLSRFQHEAFGYCTSRGYVIPNGFDLAQFRPNPEMRQAVREEVGIPESTFLVGHVARFHPMKDHANFLRAASRLIQRHNSVQFLVCGREINKENKELVSLVSEIPSERLHMLGERRDIEALMAAMDVFCLSSWSEAFPNVLGEAMASGIPCVATDVGDSARIVGDTGMVIPAHDNGALVEALEQMIALPAEKRRVLGCAARQRIEEKYSIDTVVARYCQLYEGLAKGNY